MTDNTLLAKVEKDIATLLVDKMEKFSIDFERASLIAKFVLGILPEGLSDDQVLKIIPKLDDRFIELSAIVHKYLSEYEKHSTDTRLQEIQRLIKDEYFYVPTDLIKNYWEEKIII